MATASSSINLWTTFKDDHPCSKSSSSKFPVASPKNNLTSENKSYTKIYFNKIKLMTKKIQRDTNSINFLSWLSIKGQCMAYFLSQHLYFKVWEWERVYSTPKGQRPVIPVGKAPSPSLHGEPRSIAGHPWVTCWPAQSYVKVRRP